MKLFNRPSVAGPRSGMMLQKCDQGHALSIIRGSAVDEDVTLEDACGTNEGKQ